MRPSARPGRSLSNQAAVGIEASESPNQAAVGIASQRVELAGRPPSRVVARERTGPEKATPSDHVKSMGLQSSAASRFTSGMYSI